MNLTAARQTIRLAALIVRHAPELTVQALAARLIDAHPPTPLSRTTDEWLLVCTAPTHPAPVTWPCRARRKAGETLATTQDRLPPELRTTHGRRPRTGNPGTGTKPGKYDE